MVTSKPALHLEPATSSRALAKRLESTHEWCILRYTQAVAAERPPAGAAWRALAGGHALYTGQSPFTVAIGTALHGPISNTELNEIEDFFHSRGVPSAIEVCPYSDPSLLELLQARGYRVGDMTSVLCRDLVKGPALPPANTDGISVHWAEAHEADAWVDLMSRLFYASDPGAQARANMLALFRVPDSLNAVAVVEGQVAGVAGGMLPARGEVAALFCSCTLPQFRRRGVHAALLKFRLKRALEHGCPLAAVSAIPGSDSERNLERHGFQPVYHKQIWVKPVTSLQ